MDRYNYNRQNQNQTSIEYEDDKCISYTVDNKIKESEVSKYSIPVSFQEIITKKTLDVQLKVVEKMDEFGFGNLISPFLKMLMSDLLQLNQTTTDLLSKKVEDYIKQDVIKSLKIMKQQVKRQSIPKKGRNKLTVYYNIKNIFLRFEEDVLHGRYPLFISKDEK
jgi:hypothetical protein